MARSIRTFDAIYFTECVQKKSRKKNQKRNQATQYKTSALEDGPKLRLKNCKKISGKKNLVSSQNFHAWE